MASQGGEHYVARLAIALFSLIPYILVASGGEFYLTNVGHDLQISVGTLSLIAGLGTAGYAFGAFLGGDLINRFEQRHLFLAGQCLFIIGWALVALSPGTIVYGAGRVLSAFATGTLLVTSLPPVIRQFPPSRLPLTAAFVNLGLFGAIAAGPLLGGLIGATGAWRAIYGGFAVLGIFNVLIALRVLPRSKPPNPDLPIDIAGLALGFAGTVLPFWASGELRSHGFASAVVAIPLAIGLVCFLALMVVEYHKQEALSPVAKMWTTFPVVGTLVAMAGGGAFVSFVELASNYLLKVASVSQLAAGLAFWPQLVGALIAAAALGFVFHTRFLAVQALAGMALLVVAGAILMLYTDDGDTLKLWTAVGLLGLGAGATVSPGLFLAGQSLPSQIIGRIFALIELVRSVADFIMAPVLLRIAKVASGQHRIAATGIHAAIWITLLIVLGATLLGIALYVLGGSSLQAPRLEDWIKRGRPALQSPLLLQLLRKRRPGQAARPQ